MNSKIHEWVNTGLVVLLALIVVLVGGNQSVPRQLSGTTNYDQVDTTDGFSVDGVTVIDGSGLVTGTSGSFSSLLTHNGGVLQSYVNSTSTTASMTLKESDILNYNTVLVTPMGAASAKTFTFPASSTLTSLVPTIGDRIDQCWVNGTTTAATTLIFAAGTGIDLETASSTTSGNSEKDLTLSADNAACFTFVRKTNTDVSVLMTEYGNAD